MICDAGFAEPPYGHVNIDKFVRRRERFREANSHVSAQRVEYPRMLSSQLSVQSASGQMACY